MINEDIDKIIMSFLIGNNYHSNIIALNNLLYAFEDTKKFNFIKEYKDTYFKKLFIKHKVTNINDFIKKITHKKSISKYYNFSENNVTFTHQKGCNRMIIYHLATYNNFYWKKKNIKKFHNFGYAYYDFWSDVNKLKKYKCNNCDGVHYSILRRFCIHDLQYYIVTEKKYNEENSCYKLDKTISSYKLGCYVERSDISCKLMSIAK